MSSTVIGHTKDGREIRRLVEFQPLRFVRPPRATREAAIGDDGIMGRMPMRTRAHDLTAMLIDEEVPVVGHTDEIGSTGMIGVPFEAFPRRASRGAELTHLLRESVPLVPDRRGRAAEGVSLAGSKFARGEDAQDEDEVWASAEDEDGEAAENEDAEDPETELVGFMETAHEALGALLAAWFRRRRAVGAAAGLFG